MADEISVPSHVFKSLLAQLTKTFYFVYSTDMVESYKKDLSEIEWSPLAAQTIETIHLGEEYLPKVEEEIDFPQTEEELKAAMEDGNVPTPEQ